MKRLSFLVVILVIVFGWHFAWVEGYKRLANEFEQQVEKLEEKQKHIGLDVTYVLKPYGYPFQIGLSIENLNMKASDTNGGTANVDIKGQSHMYMKAWNLPLVFLEDRIPFHIDVTDFSLDMNLDTGEEKSNLQMMMARYIAQGVVAEQMLFAGVASDIDFYVASEHIERHRFLTINNLETNAEHERVRDVFYLSENIVVKGAVLFDYDSNQSWEIDRVKAAFRVDSFPDMTALTAEVQNVSEMQAKAVDVSLTSFKSEAIKFLENMVKFNSQIHLEEYSISMDEFKGKVSGEISLSNEYIPQGKVKLELNNVDSLNNGWVGDASSTMFNLGVNNVALEVDAIGEMLIVNGMPIMQLKPISDLIHALPNEIAAEIQVDEMVDPSLTVPTPVSETAVDTSTTAFLDLTN